MLTAIGKELRKLRIDISETQEDMATRLEVSSAFLSAVELGRKRPPANFISRVSMAYKLEASAVAYLHRVVDRSCKTITLKTDNHLAREVAGLMARRINFLSEKKLKNISQMLNEKEFD